MASEKVVLWIFGCQRSGTAAVLNGLGAMTDSIVAFDEINDVIHDASRLEGCDAVRLKASKELAAIFRKQRADLLVLNPLMESQQAGQLLGDFERSAGLWLMRDYREVAASMIEKWGDQAGFVQLLPILHGTGTWREERVGSDVVEKVRELAKPGMPLADGCALFWFVRNSLFFEQGLEGHPRMVPVSYEKLVSDPAYLGKRLALVGIGCSPGAGFHPKTRVRKEKTLEISAAVAELCDEMADRLREAEGATREPAPEIARLAQGKPPAKLDLEPRGWRGLPGIKRIYREKARSEELGGRYRAVREQRDLYKRRYEALQQRFDAVTRASGGSAGNES